MPHTTQLSAGSQSRGGVLYHFRASPRMKEEWWEAWLRFGLRPGLGQARLDSLLLRGHAKLTKSSNSESTAWVAQFIEQSTKVVDVWSYHKHFNRKELFISYEFAQICYRIHVCHSTVGFSNLCILYRGQSSLLGRVVLGVMA